MGFIEGLANVLFFSGVLIVGIKITVAAIRANNGNGSKCRDSERER